MSAAKNPAVKWARFERTMSLRRARRATTPYERQWHVEKARKFNWHLVAALKSSQAATVDRVPGQGRRGALTRLTVQS